MENPPPKHEPALPVFGDSFNQLIMADIIARAGHGSWLGVHFHAECDDWVELALPWKAELAADAASGVLASGPIVSLMDTASGVAVCRMRNGIVPLATVDLRVDYMRPARPERTVIGRVECYRMTRSIAFVRGIAYDEDASDPIAHVVGTFILMQEPSA